MANDTNAPSTMHPWSFYPGERDVKMLNGPRFDQDANRTFKIDANKFAQVKDDPDALGDVVSRFINRHYTHQLKRILAMQRYYIGANDIKFWNSGKAVNRADNRIANEMPKYITNMRVGYTFGNPIRFQYNDDSNQNDADRNVVNEVVDDFDKRTNEAYHEKVMKKNLSVTGRAYELNYVNKDTNDPYVMALDPSEAFVVYDTDPEQHSLFAVHYYYVEDDETPLWYVDVYTADHIIHYQPTGYPNSQLTFDPQQKDSFEEHYFGAVPVTEYVNNDERLGDWEGEMDNFDAYDKAISEMANSEEDFSNATLVISGEFDFGTDENGKPKVHPDVDSLSRYMWLKPAQVQNGTGGNTVVPPKAEYLTKELPIDAWNAYVKTLSDNMHKFTNSPNVADENFASNASGVAMSYKLWGSDQERATQQELYARGLMRRLRLLGNYWYTLGKIKSADLIENITPIFTPNLPKNDSEIVGNVQKLSQTGDFSQQTLWEMAQPVTGIDPDEEQSRMDAQADSEPRVTMPGDYPDSFDKSSDSDSTAPEQDSNGDDTNPEPTGVQSVEQDKQTAILQAIANQRKQQGGGN
ncbi:phage portal protein [Furfurilactobacillus milii]|uniref:phage portal protein n=1 Tax=Furfurilactobacillus milii TaxID=2888272 RepID=UPI001EEE7AF6|nr:phage portal protein [Furfurilactobacillus milii]MCF6419814.1 phage portal protein [Furfurilactobacillus milii]